MEPLKDLRESNLENVKDGFIGGTSKQKFNVIHCGPSHSLVREGSDIRVVPGKESVSYEITDVPFELDFMCSSEKQKCYEHEDTKSIVCVSKSEQKVPDKKLYKMSKDKVVDFASTNEMNMCYHQEMRQFPNGTATVFHKDPVQCGKITNDTEKVCKESGSSKCDNQIHVVTNVYEKCTLIPNNFSERMAAFPYTSQPDYEALVRKIDKKKFDTILKTKSKWAQSVVLDSDKENKTIIAPTPCEELGNPCGYNQDKYHGQCVSIKANSDPVCRPILNEEDLKDAQLWMESHSETKKIMKKSKHCGNEYKNFEVCDEFDNNGLCIHTVTRYNNIETGQICNNPYYKTTEQYLCQTNKQDFSSENETETHYFNEKLGNKDLKTKCLSLDKGFGVSFYQDENQNICNVLQKELTGDKVSISSSKNGSVCLPFTN